MRYDLWWRVAVVSGMAILACALSFLVFHVIADGRTLDTPKREVLVEEVENGYLLSYREQHNPYPVARLVAHNVEGAGTLVQALLKRPISKPRWGR